MKSNYIKQLLSLVIAAGLLAGCADSSSSQSDSSSGADTSTTTSAPPQTTTTTTTTTTQEVSYMEQIKDSVEELMPKEYDEEREGVKYGEFQKYTYYSTTAERDTNVNVLLPPDYSDDKKYPVLYILHGYYDNEDWMARGIVNLNQIYGNLLAEGKAEEMIIVLPYIFCDKNMPYCTGMNYENNMAYDNFINDLTTDLMPFIESEFSVATGRENTAITGFSMGGRESFFIGFKHPELFGYIGSCCTAPGLVGDYGCPLKEDEMKFTDNEPFVVFISSSRTDGVVGASPDGYRGIMHNNGVEFISHVMSNTGHDHSSVRPHLYNFLQMLFK